MQERIQKILSARGAASRRRAEEWIARGLVTVNGKIAALGDKADPERDEICIQGRPLPRQQRQVYLLLNKPRGYVTTLSDEKGRPNVSELTADCGVRVYPVGRLDMDSEGLLLLTNDGAFANGLAHPKGEVPKTYRVWVTGWAPGAEALLARPIRLDGYTIRPPRVRLLEGKENKARLEITIHEGRNRQVRRMCQAAGMEVTRLVRIREGSLSLGKLAPGAWRQLTSGELSALRREAGLEEAGAPEEGNRETCTNSGKWHP